MIAVTVIAGVAITIGYAIACRFWPYANCRRCEGSGQKRSPSGRNWRACRKCKGSGTRVRTGRRRLDWASGTIHKALS